MNAPLVYKLQIMFWQQNYVRTSTKPKKSKWSHLLWTHALTQNCSVDFIHVYTGIKIMCIYCIHNVHVHQCSTCTCACSTHVHMYMYTLTCTLPLRMSKLSSCLREFFLKLLLCSQLVLQILLQFYSFKLVTTQGLACNPLLALLQ